MNRCLEGIQVLFGGTESNDFLETVLTMGDISTLLEGPDDTGVELTAAQPSKAAKDEMVLQENALVLPTCVEVL